MSGFEWGKRRRNDENKNVVLPKGALPQHDSDEFDVHTSVLEAEQVVTAALGRWATSAGLHGGNEEFLPYRTAIHAREMDKVLAAAAREDQAA